MMMPKRRFVATVCSVFCSASLTYESPFFFVFRGVLPCLMPIHTLYPERQSKAFLGAYLLGLRVEVAKLAEAPHLSDWGPDRNRSKGKVQYGLGFVFLVFDIAGKKKALQGLFIMVIHTIVIFGHIWHPLQERPNLDCQCRILC